MNQNLQELISASVIQYSPTQIVLNMVLTLFLSTVIFYIYKWTYSGVMYSREFNMTLMLITLVTSMVIMIIGGNLTLSLGMVGALSIIRFRSAIKDPKDIGFLFWGITAGLASGTGAYTIAVIGTLIISLIMLTSSLKKSGSNAYLVIVKGIELQSAVIEAMINQYGKHCRLRMHNHSDAQQELIFEVRIKMNHSEVVKKLKEEKGVDTVHLVTFNGETNS